MISAVLLENYKGHERTRVELGKITMLVGPNGAGKTSVLEAIHDMARLVVTPPGEVFSGGHHPGFVARRGAVLMRIAIEQKEEEGGPVEPTLQADRSGEGDATSWAFAIRLRDIRTYGNAPFSRIDTTRNWSFLSQTIRYRFDAEVIAGPSVDTETTPRIKHDGEHTATVLASMKLEDDERFARVEDALRRVVPQLKRIHPKRSVERTPEGDRNGFRLSYDFTHAAGVAAHCVSEGTLITTALLTVLLGDNPSRVLLFDDIDQALHPAAQLILIRQLKAVLEEHPELQIVATTHSPYILDELEPEDVRVFAQREDGTVAVKKLSEHPEASKMKGALTTGQIWGLDPEQSWVTAPAIVHGAGP